MDIGSKNEFITLQEATKFCEYSQDYLSLRARQGKLQAVKLGRNWSTTIQWLQEYIARSNDYKNSIPQHADESISLKFIAPPGNLPVEEEEISEYTATDTFAVAPLRGFQEVLKFAAAFTAVLVFIGASGMAQKDAFEEISYAVYPAAENIARSVGATSFEIYSSPVLESSVSAIGSQYISWLGRTVSSLSGNIMSGAHNAYQSSVRIVRSFGAYVGSRFVQGVNPVAQQETAGSEDMLIPANPKKGLVVVPSSSNNEQLQAQIQESFSDDVEIIAQDDESGIITPVFREKKGEDYFYILVPLQEQDAN